MSNGADPGVQPGSDPVAFFKQGGVGGEVLLPKGIQWQPLSPMPCATPKS